MKPNETEEMGQFIPLSTLDSSDRGPEPRAQSPELPYWRSLEEWANTPEYQAGLAREFSAGAPGEWAALNRRDFLRVMGATLALAGASGCAYQPAEKIVPYVKQPEEIVPGKPLFYTTAFEHRGYALGVLGESHMGRPTKIEGNPQHPASLGATDTHAQASLIELYDPDRSQAVRNLGEQTTWDTFLAQLSTWVGPMRARQGAGLRVLVETVTSPTLTAQLNRLIARYPQAKVYRHDPVGRDNVHEGARLAFGAPANPVYHFERAERILSLDSDFFMDEPGSIRYTHDFAERRRVRKAKTRQNRLYVVESGATITGVTADHRVALPPSRIEAFARSVAAALGVPGLQTDVPGVPEAFIPALVKDLQAHRGMSLVIAGPRATPAVHALAHAMNQALGNLGQTVTFTEPVETTFSGDLAALTQEMNAGQVNTLFILGSNPAYTAPANVDFKAALEKVERRVHMGSHDDETGILCQWHIPQSHYLEAWSDTRAYDGTATIVQPLIHPLYASKSPHELLAALLGEGDRAGYDIVREYWQKRTGSANFQRLWHQILVSGTVPGTAAPRKQVALRGNLSGSLPAAATAAEGEMEVVFWPDPAIGDGRWANNPWLQELPRPITSVTWDNPALISPATARQRNLRNGQMVELDGKLRVPVWIVPGQPENTLTLALGYGRTHAGKIGTGRGFNAYLLRTLENPSFRGVSLNTLGESFPVATTQRHFDMEGRHLVQSVSLDRFAANPSDPNLLHREHAAANLYPPVWPSDEKVEEGGRSAASAEHGGTGPESGIKADTKVGTWSAEKFAQDGRVAGYNNQPVPAWGMVVDLTACVGCGACVLACQAENNIATVGKDQVMMHRMMQWIRIDTYFQGTPDAPEETVFQPLFCMHCEKAPCEPVCPVEATTHSAEGINEMTYNRCIGTRYCQNNCPYKVRRFNYLQYSDQKTPTIQLMRNPDVTVRSRGVMEKCTYCVHRINEARMEAEKEDRPIRDGDILTACQQVCPTQAIIFGNLNDTQSHGGQGSVVRQLKHEPLNYALLTELNTKPRTSFLARVRNLNPELAPAGSGATTEGASHG
jgi:molybdopterin-containing oxidoreductase family iron-sulfur binding subunit